MDLCKTKGTVLNEYKFKEVPFLYLVEKSCNLFAPGIDEDFTTNFFIYNKNAYHEPLRSSFVLSVPYRNGQRSYQYKVQPIRLLCQRR